MASVRGSRGLSFRAAFLLAILGFGLGALAGLIKITYGWNALWHVVHDLCEPDMRTFGHPAPCAAVDLARGFAVVKDIRGRTQYLLVPLDRLVGVEDPKLLAPDAPNYWQASWEARSFFERAAGHAVARENIALAINSPEARSQEQFHIHIDCVKPDVKAALAAHISDVNETWAPLNVILAGHRFRARWLAGENLDSADPFRLVASDLGAPGTVTTLGGRTVVAIGDHDASGAPGFVLLYDKADFWHGDSAAGEDVMDHGCAVLSQ